MALIVFLLAVVGGALLLLVSRASRLSAMWGALFGVLIGSWALAPLILRVHYLRPESFLQWAVLDLGLLVVFGALGAILSFLACAPISFWQLVARQDPLRPDLQCASTVAGLLPAAYLTFSALIEWRNFSRLPAATGYRTAALWGVTLSLGGLLLLLAYRRASSTSRRPTDATLRLGAASFALLGFLVLPFRIGPAPAHPAAPTGPLPRMRAARSTTPLLIVGLDGGNWPTLKPLVAKNLLPTFGGLITDGLHGEAPAVWPPYWSAPSWGAILTGHSREEIGVHEDLTATARGLPPFELPLTLSPELDPVFYVEYVMVQLGLIRPAPPPRTALRQPPLWELLSKSGVTTAVIRFPFTFPASGQADLVVSERIVTDLWDALGVTAADRRDLVAPGGEADRVFTSLSDADRSADAALAEVFPAGRLPRPPDAVKDPFQFVRELLGLDDVTHVALGLVTDPVQLLQTVLGFDHRALYATEQIIRTHPDLDVVMVYIGGFDLVCHAFWQYRFPEAFPDRPPPPAADVQRLGPVIDQYLQLLDRRIGRLASAFGTPPNILVISDHGEQPSQANPLWRGEHSAHGIFILAGPDIPRVGSELEVPYSDVVPTVLDLEGLEKPRSMTGESVLRKPR